MQPLNPCILCTVCTTRRLSAPSAPLHALHALYPTARHCTLYAPPRQGAAAVFGFVAPGLATAQHEQQQQAQKQAQQQAQEARPKGLGFRDGCAWVYTAGAVVAFNVADGEFEGWVL